MSAITGKVWGTTENILTTPMVELHRIRVVSNSQCSLHRHDHKWNGFYVLSGSLIIEAHKNEYDLVDRTVLTAGQFTSIPPGELHRFVCESPAVALELYWIDGINPMDIVREDVGGLNDI